MLLIVGLCGCLLTGAIILVNGWYGVRGAAIPGGLNAYILPAAACILLPVLVLRWGSWRFPLKQRRSAAIARIFGGETRAIGFAQSLRRLPHKPGRVSLWAFPMGAGGWLTRFDGAASWAIFAILMTLFFQAGNVPELLTGAISVIALLFLPVNITGFGMAFGKWKVAHDMTYPLAIFFDDMDHLT
ncbi:hypothetical protein HF289_05500 [Acidithiobacillus ferrooxidans]|uniref:hypothetical protein n=1 Tax=Acidithiobacillus ferrooxidans TaxID=920 RepID=UPI001C06860E|nr:hypothetical protein [Acidithiobacillus ferrooxidans]MBU2856346.1 hypothetical protein [Acidithiobacillus ferrooxidans]MBU2861468.1 hypothetical protein [Acidithiobacillus ferrooxidans]